MSLSSATQTSGDNSLILPFLHVKLFSAGVKIHRSLGVLISDYSIYSACVRGWGDGWTLKAFGTLV